MSRFIAQRRWLLAAIVAKALRFLAVLLET
jgi:hypothetical protein